MICKIYNAFSVIYNGKSILIILNVIRKIFNVFSVIKNQNQNSFSERVISPVTGRRPTFAGWPAILILPAANITADVLITH